jgi:hypothetical protein
MARTGVDSLPDPPDAPEMPRRISLHRNQWVLIALMLCLPVLALLGVFGGRATRRGEAGPLAVNVRYPTALRYNVFDNIELHVQNRGAAVLDTVSVAIDSAYATRFSMITSIPPFEEAFRVTLPQLRAGESRPVRVELRAERYWRHRGIIAITAGGADTLRIRLSTIVFP